MVGDLIGVLKTLFFQELRGFFEEVHVDIIRDVPVLFRNQLWRRVNCISRKRGSGLYTILAFGFGLGLRSLLELRGERLVVEKDIGVIELGVPGPLQVANARNQLVKLLVPDEGDDGCVGSGGVGAVRRVIVLVGAPQVALGLTGYYNSEDAMLDKDRTKIIESREEFTYFV